MSGWELFGCGFCAGGSAFTVLWWLGGYFNER